MVCLLQISLSVLLPRFTCSKVIISLVCHQAEKIGGAIVEAVSSSVQRCLPQTPMVANLLPAAFVAVGCVGVVGVEDGRD